MNKMAKIEQDGEGAAGAETAVSNEPVTVPKRSRKRLVLMLSVPLILVAAGLYFWLTSGKTVETDNAYVKQDITSISTQVNGPVSQVFVRENQHVNKGDLLYRVDARPFIAALHAAEAQLAAAQLQTKQLEVQAAGTGGTIVGAQANLQINERALARQSELLKEGFTTRANYDDAVNEVAKARSQLSQAQAASNNAYAAVAPGGNQPQIEAAMAAVEKARLDLSHTEIRAPVSGIVSKADRLLVGQTAITGVSMLSIVADTQAWVEANFKEGDLAKMRPGLPATVKFDAYPGVKLAAHVASIGAGTGSEFSVLPAQNANGNWVKVTQRVPVRIAFDKKPPREMIAGLSSVVEVELKR